jgi:hypothetical protein
LKALYGLKQAGHIWNKQLNDYLINHLDFIGLRSDPCIYLKRRGDDLIILAVYVDDILLIHNQEQFCDETITSMAARWEISDVGHPTRLLGMRLTHDLSTGSISLDQEEYVIELLKRFNMVDCKTEATPHQPGVYLTKEFCPSNQEEVNNMATVPYGKLVGSLLWLSTNTRPDIATAVATLCRFVSNPGRRHWHAAQRVLRYLAGTSRFGIRFTKSANMESPLTNLISNAPTNGNSVFLGIVTETGQAIQILENLHPVMSFCQPTAQSLGSPNYRNLSHYLRLKPNMLPVAQPVEKHLGSVSFMIN